MRPVGTFGAQHFQAGFAEIRQLLFGQQAPAALQDGLADARRLGRSSRATYHQGADQAPTITVSRGDLEGGARRPAARAFDPHAVGARPGEGDLREVASHVRQQVGGRVLDLVEHLLGDCRGCHQATGTRRLADHEALAVGIALGYGETHVFPAGHFFPVGEQAAGALGTAFDDVAGQAAAGELVRRQRDGAVDHAPRDDDVRTGGQGSGNRLRAQVGVDAEERGRQWGTAAHFMHAGGTQLFHPVRQVVAFDDGDLHRDALLCQLPGQCLAAGARIDAACVGNHANALRRDLRCQTGDHLDEVGCVTGVG